MVALTVTLYAYASVQEEVALTSGPSPLLISRDAFFYAAIGLLAVFNTLVFVLSRLRKEEDFLSWFYGLIACFNLFFVFVQYFINLLNSNERYDFERLGFAVYGTVGLVIVWALAWPVYLLVRGGSRGK